MSMLRVDPKIIEEMRKKSYGVWNHSAVQICSWTKKAILREGTCYKNKFYGIDTHRCMEMTPISVFCTNNCIYCWRPMEFMKLVNISPDDVDDPEDIYNHLLEERKKLLTGFWGNEKADKKLLEEAMTPNHFAISLSGEPTLYPKLPEMIRFLRNLPQTKSIFIVTNGQEPDMIKRLIDEDSLPTQLYVSITAPNEELYKKISVPNYPDAWNRLMKTLDLLKDAPVRKVARLTMIKGWNMSEELIPEYLEVLDRMNPHFVEVKAYMYLGYSTHRLKWENMPTHEEIREYAKKMEDQSDWLQYMDEQVPSRIVVMNNKENCIDPIIKEPYPKLKPCQSK